MFNHACCRPPPYLFDYYQLLRGKLLPVFNGGLGDRVNNYSPASSYNTATTTSNGGGSSTSAGAAVVEEPSMTSSLTPNLTSCHWSYSDHVGRPLFCCKASPDPRLPVVDFQFPDHSDPIRVRRPVHRLSADFIAKYEKAFAIMKSLPDDHPHNFWRQADQHCLYCTGSYEQTGSDALLFVHRDWLFFPFHRAYIYFHERIIGKLIGDDTFALPYWPWDVPEGMLFPDFYHRGAFNDSERDFSHLIPLHQTADIAFDGVESGLGAADQVAANLAMMYHQMVSGARKPELFMGCRMRPGRAGACDGPGTIELIPHNTMHEWVTNRANPDWEDMGSYYTASRDPSFYAHHSNIDRLWSVWKELHGGRLEFDDPAWLDAAFYFRDENLRLVRVRVRDVLDMSKLRYTYEEIDRPWLETRPKPAVEPKVARGILREMEARNRVLRMPGGAPEAPSGGTSPDFGPGGRMLEEPLRVKVPRPKRVRSAADKAEEEEVLVVYGIEVKRDTFVKFDVLVNAVDEAAVAGPRSREYAGAFVNVNRGVAHGDPHKRKATLKLGITELLEDLEAEADDSIWVTLVPKGGTGVDVTVGGVRIEYLR
ncbi:hypothetical protein Taro_044944 [Colocasia esculenta]|uniref:Tyrosinase copper-binding domain-containing protein n=1 Tax=Colocasia esculenta TaxID=4460 RepID=A0A843WKM3_COLES|nr:hypothetical protein [Colocasia esculenta]